METKNVAIAGVVALACVAIMHGLNGVVIATSMAIVAGLGGFEVGIHRRKA